MHFRDDSIISLAADWYRNGKDPEKLARALMYLVRVRYVLIPMDSLPYLQMKEAVQGIIDLSLEDPTLLVLLYGYLGDINLRNINYTEAEVYYEMGLVVSYKDGKLRYYVLAFINLFYAKLF